MDCNRAEELIPLYIDNELYEEERSSLEEHLLSCESCKTCYEEIRSIAVTLYSIEDDELPEGFHKEFMNKLDDKTKPTPKLWNYKAISMAAACAAVVLIAVSALSVGISSLTGSNQTVEAPSIIQTQALYGESVETDSSGASAPMNMASALAADAIYDGAGAIVRDLSAADPISSSITRYNIQLTVDDIQKAMNKISLYSGMQESMSYSMPAYEGAQGSAYISRRVSAQEFEIVKDQLRTLGEVIDESEYKQSMARQLRDLNARLTAKDDEKDRLLALLGKSGDLDVMVRVESRLNNVSDESDSLNAQIRDINLQIGQPYINIQLYNRVYVPSAPPKQGFGVRMANSFKQSVNGTVMFMQSLLLFVVSAAIPLLVIIIIAALLYLMYRFTVKRRKGRRGE